LACLATLLAAAAPTPPPPLQAETSDVAKLGKFGAHWLFAETLPSGMTLVDADSGKILAGVPMNFDANLAIAPDHAHLYVAETLWTEHTRGTRQDFFTTYDASTLDILHEAPLPPRALTVFKAQDLALSASGRTAYVFNLTPATSVTVVDVASGHVTQKIDTPGCGLIYPWQDGGFSSLCGNGTLLNIALPAGGPPAVTHSAAFFDAKTDPVYESSLVDVGTGQALFITFTGKVFPVTLGPAPVIGTPWSLQEAAGQKAAGTGVQELAWRPGGYQVATWHKASGRLFVLMHPGTYWTQKTPGTEVWVFDMKTKKLLSRITLKSPAKGVAVSQDAAPLLYATTAEGEVFVINADTGETLRSVKLDGGGPLLVVAGL
jgi:methylamine dehydrogenase heavy chain